MKNIIFIILALSIIGIFVFSLVDSQKAAVVSHKEALEKHRIETDEYFRTNKDSPFESKEKMTELKYFEADSSYKIVADVQFVQKSEQTKFMMTDSSTGEVKKVGVARFELAGKTFSLSFYKENDHYFIPFKDLTNGNETYGAGRYLNVSLDKLKDKQMEIDFNYAYNPYCAYNHTFVCPIPPKENSLLFSVSVGEKIYE